MAPAQVPKMAPPRPASSRMPSSSPSPIRNFKCVVLSPPGSTSASNPSRSTGLRTKRGSVPSRASIWACASQSPCTARTPIFMAPASLLAPARLQQLFFLELPDVNPLHGLAELLGSLQHDLGVVEVRGRFHNGAGALVRVARFEDPRAHEDRLGAQVPHQGRVGG